MISWVLASRNDGYGGTVDGVENFTMRRLQLTVHSIRAFRHHDEIVVVDWCPDPNVAPLASFLIGLKVKVITVDKGAQEICGQMVFYEYVAKMVGAAKATGNYLILCNGDNIYPAEGFVSNPPMGVIQRAVRYDIGRETANMNAMEILHGVNAKTIPLLQAYPMAAGDFTGIWACEFWDALYGYDLRHINWHTDNDLIERGGKASMRVVNKYIHYHIDHDGSHGEAQGRSRDFASAEPIHQNEFCRVMGFADYGMVV